MANLIGRWLLSRNHFMKRILSIDGGGIKGVFPAAFLANLEQSIRGPIADYFDLIVGTSTGGIIALGLGLGLGAREMLDLYRPHPDPIFPNQTFPGRINQFFNPK